MAEFIERLELGPFATFIPNKYIPVYNWLYYKEGFSRNLVFRLIDELGLKKNDLVLDPFCGVGTTQLACKEKSLKSIGFDVSPVALLAAKVKLEAQDIEGLKAEARKFFKQKFQKPEFRIDLPVIKKAFSKYALEDIFFFKKKINEIPDEKTRDFFLLALINASTKCSFAIKSGAMLRIDKRRKVPPVKIMLQRIIYRMIHDLENFKAEKVEAIALKGDARKFDAVEDESIDAVITSPPYLNKIEYTNVYAIEQYLFFEGQLFRPAVRSYIGEETKDIEDVFQGKIAFMPLIAKAYFKDMKLVLQEMFRVLKKGCFAAIIVGNGCFPEAVLQSDELLAGLAEEIGFKAKPIAVLNRRWCMKERTQKVGLMRESLLILEKPSQ